MLAPYCEAEAAEPVVRDLGLESLAIWKETYPGVVAKGTLVVAGTRDRAELERFARMTEGFDELDADAVAVLEPGLEGRFAAALYYPAEAHMAPRAAMQFLLDAARTAGVEVLTGAAWPEAGGDAGIVIDCRGLGARTRASRPARRARRAADRAHARGPARAPGAAPASAPSALRRAVGATGCSWSARP